MSHLFWSYLQVAAIWVVLLSLFRFNFYFLSIYHAYPNASIIELIHSFWAGLRFDTLILGFLSIPIYVLLVLMGLLSWWPKFLWNLCMAYLYGAWILICSMTFFDFFYFAKYGRHLRWAQYQSWDWPEAVNWVASFDPGRRWTFIAVWFLISIAGVLAMRHMQFGNWKDWASPLRPKTLEKSLRVLLPAVLIALAARGTISAHHLRYEDSQVSFTEAINEMALNAPWCFDK